MTTLRKAYAWLNQFERSCLSGAAFELLHQIQAAFDREDYDSARALGEKLLNTVNNGGDEEAEAFVVGALTYYNLNMRKAAVELLHKAWRKYLPNHHHAAVAKWMEGCVLWDIPDSERMESPYTLWNESREWFRELAGEQTMPALRVRWYRERIKEMDQALSESVRVDAVMPIPETGVADQTTALRTHSAGGLKTEPDHAAAPADPQKTNAQTPPPVPGKPKRGRADPQGTSAGAAPGWLVTFPIRDQIRAGEPMAVGYDPYEIGKMEISEVVLEGRPHSVINLQGNSKSLNLYPYIHSGEDLVVLRVKGDSMNLAGIDDGDFILLRQTSSANHNDIVAAQITHEEERATLKRLIIEHGRRILRPESKNKIYQPIIFARGDNRFSIVGVALAVFKAR